MNTQTGQISRDLPVEADETASDGDLSGLASSITSRMGTSASTGFGASLVSAGFGVSKHTEIPEPWVRKLADDGMSYYFTNNQTGEIRWSVPEAEVPARGEHSRAPTNSSSASYNTVAHHRLRADSSVSLSRQGSESSADHTSLYSDDSDTLLMMERDRNGSVSVTGKLVTNGHEALDWDHSASPDGEEEDRPGIELTTAERAAKSLQLALSPPSRESLIDLSAAARQAIMTVIEGIQVNDVTRFMENDVTLDNLVYTVVISIRNLLYVSAAPAGHIPSTVIPGARGVRDRRDTTASQALLKPAQRKVTATLSKLVLSARAIQYNSGSSIIDTPIRIAGDAEELERAVAAFILEVQRSHNQQIHSSAGLKRLRGVFSTSHIGLGLVGAGAAGSWKGLGWVSLEETDDAPGRILGTEVVAELRTYILQVQERFSSFGSSIEQLIKEPGKRSLLVTLLILLCLLSNSNIVAQLYTDSRSLILQLSSLLEFVGNIHVARHVDIDGIRREPGNVPNEDLYNQTVENARLLIRTLEVATQSLFEDGSSFFMTAQAIHRHESSQPPERKSVFFDRLDAFSLALKANLGVVLQTFEALLSIGHDQADMAQGDYNGSIEWRMSRLSVIDTQFGGAHRPLSTFNSYGEDMVDMELAFQKPGMKTQTSVDSSTMYHNGSLASETTLSVSDTSYVSDTSTQANGGASMDTLMLPSPFSATELSESHLYEEERECPQVKFSGLAR